MEQDQPTPTQPTITEEEAKNLLREDKLATEQKYNQSRQMGKKSVIAAIIIAVVFFLLGAFFIIVLAVINQPPCYEPDNPNNASIENPRILGNIRMIF